MTLFVFEKYDKIKKRNSTMHTCMYKHTHSAYENVPNARLSPNQSNIKFDFNMAEKHFPADIYCIL